MTAESPELAAAKRLLDAAKRGGFSFQRVAPGPDGPLWGVRETLRWRDTLNPAGRRSSVCSPTRALRRPAGSTAPARALSGLSGPGNRNWT